jgi:hypothetical protein
MAGAIGNALGAVDSLLASVMPGGGGDRPGERQLPKPYAEWDADKILWNRERVGKGCQKTMESGEKTIYEVMQKAIATHGDRLTAGKRALIERHYDDQGRYVLILHRKPSCTPQSSVLPFTIYPLVLTRTLTNPPCGRDQRIVV